MPKNVYSSKHGNVTIYSEDEVAVMFDIKPDMVAPYIKTGEIKGEKMGSGWYLAEDVVRGLGKGAGEGGLMGIVSRFLSRFK